MPVKTAVAVQVVFNLKSVTDLRDSSGRSQEAPTDVNRGYPADVVHLRCTKLQTHCSGGQSLHMSAGTWSGATEVGDNVAGYVSLT